jgi:hypothetical protein
MKCCDVKQHKKSHSLFPPLTNHSSKHLWLEAVRGSISLILPASHKMASSVRALTSKGRLTPLCRVRASAPALSVQKRGNATIVPFRLPAARNEPNVSKAE